MEPANPPPGSAKLGKLFELMDQPDFREGEHWFKKTVATNTAVIRKGECSEKLYLVNSGKLNVQEDVELDDQRHIKPGMAEITTGGVFGELALFDNEPHGCSVIALTEVQLIVIDAPKLLHFLSKNSDIGYPVLFEMMQQLAGRFRATSKRTAALFAWGLKAHGIESHL